MKLEVGLNPLLPYQHMHEALPAHGQHSALNDELVKSLLCSHTHLCACVRARSVVSGELLADLPGIDFNVWSQTLKEGDE